MPLSHSAYRRVLRPLGLLVATFVLANCASSGASRNPQSPPQTAYSATQPAQLFAGVRYWRETRSDPLRQVFHVIEMELETPGLELFVTPMSAIGEPEYRAQTTSRFVADSQALLAVNASYFVPFKSGARGGDDFVPKAGDHTDAVGTVIAAGHRVSSVSSGADPRINAILCIYPGTVSIHRGEVCGNKVVDAIAAGPLLLVKGEAQPFHRTDPRYARKRHPRTSFGLSENGKIGWLVVVDGRQSVTSEGATLDELTAFYRSLGAADAINLDGGGSTTLVIADQDGQPKVLNSPIHTGVPGRERPVANHLGLRRNPIREARVPPLTP